MMKKLGSLIPPFQQLCNSHGLQLVIQDVLYLQTHNTEKLFYYSSTSETDAEDYFEIMDHNDEID